MKQLKWHILYVLLVYVYVLPTPRLYANNLSIQNTQLVNKDNTADEVSIQFDISWDNSWRDTENWDAVWLFVKYRIQGSTAAWSHASLTSTGSISPTGSTLDVSTDQKGAFLYRSANASGTVTWTNVRLRWEYGTDGLIDADIVEVKVLGIEMVYVPTGAFWIGDGENRAGELYGNLEDGVSGNPLQITSEAALTLGGGAAGSIGNNNEEGMYCCGGLLGGAADDFDDVNTQVLPAAYPKGFDAFYCMKYEITQAEYVALINTVDATQASYLMQTGHFVAAPNPPAYYRYGLTGTHPNITTTHPYAPMIYLDWTRGAPFADWAGLRPMTELEFEKTCRGPNLPIIGEYPWGTGQMDLSDNLVLVNEGAANENISAGYTASPTVGNAWIRAGGQTMDRIARVGIFAANAANLGRVSAGASYWGILELGGNAWERCVNIGHPQGRMFDGSHGDGVLHPNGYSNQANWPGQPSTPGQVDSNMGVGYRGGGFDFPTPIQPNCRISSRVTNSEFWNITLYDDAMRFVRTVD